MARRTDAETRGFIRNIIADITGQTLSSRRIKLLTNPHAGNQIAFHPSTRYIYWIQVGSRYHQGLLDLLRAPVVHEAMNTKVKTPIIPLEVEEGEEIVRACANIQKRIQIRTHYEIEKHGWLRIKDRKLEVDALSLEWYRKHHFDIVWYIQFLMEEWNAAQDFDEPRRRFHRLIGIKRVRQAAMFREHCTDCNA